MKHTYFSIPLLTLSLVAGTASAQMAKPRPEKTTSALRTARPLVTQAQPVGQNRGGSNDECSTATLVTVAAECSGSMAAYDATDASESQPAILCNGYTSPEARDLWFTFEAISTITNITVEGTLTFDAVIEGFEGSCGDLSSVGCADATFPPVTPANTSETLTMVTNVGQTYFVRVYSYWSPVPTNFEFTLCIYAPPVAPNDLCSAVAPVAISAGTSQTFTGDNTDALDTEGLGAPTVWHSFTIDQCSDVTVDYCGTSPVFGNSAAIVFTTCPAGADVFEASVVDQSTCSDGNYSMVFSALPAGTYYYPVIKDEANAAVGAYTVNVSVALPTAYCDAALNVCDETIGQVQVGTIDNTSDCAAGTVVDYTDQSTDIYQSNFLPVTVTNGGTTYAENAVTVWVDWNQNNAFCEGNEEHVLVSADDGATFTGNILCPPDALLGSTRMRVRMAYNAAPVACGLVVYGEIEDYTVNVLLNTGINENNSLDWAVFPNPNDGDMTVRFGGVDAKVMIELFDVAGRTVHQEQRQLFNGQQVAMGLAGKLAHGAYTLRLTSPEGRSTQRVVVQ